MQFIDFAALEYNARYFKNILGMSRLCAVVKNNAYGHGIEHVARYLDGLVDCFAVGSVAEAKQISFVHNDILILLPQNYENCKIAIASGFILTCDSFASLETIVKVASELHNKARVHIKINSGMSRLGFDEKSIDELTVRLQNCNQIVVEGAYSHFYGENTLQCNKQLERFLPCANAVEKALKVKLKKHIANTVGAVLSDEYHLDMARIGLGLYGYGCENLQKVKTVTAQVIAVRNVNVGDVVGYGAVFVSQRLTKIAVLNIGYAQGFCRTLVGASVCVKGKMCKVVAVCMAMTMIDLGDADNVSIGDEAVLLGKDANIANEYTSIYELLCNLR